jgi:protein gp37
MLRHDGKVFERGEPIDTCCHNCHSISITRVGKKAAGRMLDGREWNEMPKATVTA